LNEPNAVVFLKTRKTMGATIITTEDLMEFKMELLEDIKELLHNNEGPSGKRWLKSKEVRELLGISPGTLQNLRINGTLPYTRIGGVLYYDHGEIMEVLERNKVNPRF
jgi:predicted DNA-binding transcriptional regulator AlpA